MNVASVLRVSVKLVVVVVVADVKMKITKDMTIGEVIEKRGEKAAVLLMEAGMGCVGCPMAQMESLEAGCLGHGLSEKDIKKLVEKLNGK